MYSLKQSDHLASFVFICKRSITINCNAKKKSDGVKHNYFFSLAVGLSNSAKSIPPHVAQSIQRLMPPKELLCSFQVPRSVLRTKE